MTNKTLITIGKILGIIAGVFMIIGGINLAIGSNYGLRFSNNAGYSIIDGLIQSFGNIIVGIVYTVIGILFIIISAPKKTTDATTTGILLLVLSLVFSNLLGLLASILILIGTAIK